ncbi:MAG: hypothetical protein KGH61_00245 [Candidatus Micrarchaeota archaeon]|nr:hypothetical protein [Candidatus Micrarchaeota archaeon]MDE1847366.1 hypothetical protein [Candidatus Micrarchaeota archaeon]MDE1863981.1 hypothetical protein [Candidatus Micrarchaeota archaeon]
MIEAYLTIALSFVMGLSIFLSMPIVFHRHTSTRHMIFFNAVAIGILIFLLMDIFGNVAAIFGNAIGFNAMELVFIIGFTLSFLFFIAPKENRELNKDPKRTSILAAIGIGFQNLTEGLVFGSAGAAGIIPIYLVSLIGFTLQNITEGFPIAAPLMGLKQKLDKRFVTGAFLLGGVPTILGTLVGLVFFSNIFIIFFDALASAAILYVVLVLLHVNLRRSDAEGAGKSRAIWLTYAGILLGFVVAFVVNYL